MAAKKTTDAKAKAPAAKPESPKAELPQGKGSQNTKPPASNPDPIPRGQGQRPVKKDGTDTIRRQSDKARWPGYGPGADSISTLLNEQRNIEGREPLADESDGDK